MMWGFLTDTVPMYVYVCIWWRGLERCWGGAVEGAGEVLGWCWRGLERCCRGAVEVLEKGNHHPSTSPAPSTAPPQHLPMCFFNRCQEWQWTYIHIYIYTIYICNHIHTYTYMSYLFLPVMTFFQNLYSTSTAPLQTSSAPPQYLPSPWFPICFFLIGAKNGNEHTYIYIYIQSYTYIYIHVLPILTCYYLFPKPLQHLPSTSPDLSSTTPVMMMMIMIMMMMMMMWYYMKWWWKRSWSWWSIMTDDEMMNGDDHGCLIFVPSGFHLVDVGFGGLWGLLDWCSASAIWSKRSSSISCLIPSINI